MFEHPIRALVAVAAAATACIALPSQAEAWNGGVASTTFYSVDTECTDGQGLPCPPGATVGPSNTIYVGQEIVDGEPRFNSISTTSQSADSVWVQTRIGAECRTGYRLDAVFVAPGGIGNTQADARIAPDQPTEVMPLAAIAVPHPDAKTMPVKDQALHFDIDALVGYSGSLFAGHEDLFDFGENVIADRVADGEDEDAVRAAGFAHDMVVPLTATFRCEGVVRGVRWVRRTAHYMSLHLVFLGHQQGAGSNVPTLPEAVPTQVTQATLSVLAHPSDPCLVVASGTFVTNAPTTVDYRIVDNLGQTSQTYSVDVDQTFVAFVSHDVAVPPSPLGADLGGLVAAPGGGGPVGGFVDRPSDSVSNVLWIEVLSPNSMMSAPDGFRVPPCSPSAAQFPGQKVPALGISRS